MVTLRSGRQLAEGRKLQPMQSKLKKCTGRTRPASAPRSVPSAAPTHDVTTLYNSRGVLARFKRPEEVLLAQTGLATAFSSIACVVQSYAATQGLAVDHQALQASLVPFLLDCCCCVAQ